MAFCESHQSEGVQRFILVTADSKELLKGYFEKTALYNYRRFISPTVPGGSLLSWSSQRRGLNRRKM